MVTNKLLKPIVKNARNVYVDALVVEDVTPVKVSKAEILRILDEEPEDQCLWEAYNFGDGDILLSN